jgi:hypothetical protein
MPGDALQSLTQPTPAVLRAAGVNQGFDACLVAGFGRLGPGHERALASFSGAFAGTPLGGPVSRALAAVRGNEFRADQFVVLAAARCALEAAAYDALRRQAEAALGRPAADGEVPTAASGTSGPTTVALGAPAADASSGPAAAAGHWLMEMAIAGFAQLDAAAVAPFATTLDHLLADPARGRLAALLSGFHRELLLAIPVGSAADVPARRWADLWSRAFVASLAAAGPGDAARAGPAVDDVGGVTRVTGRLTPLGVDVRRHGTFASAVVFGLFDEAAAAANPPAGGRTSRVVRVTLGGYKVDALDGADVWKVLAAANGDAANNNARPLLQAVGEGRPLDVAGATLLPTSDLLWDGSAKVVAGAPVDLPAVAAKHLAPGVGTATPGVAPVDRHPVQLAEMVWLDGVTVSAGDDPWRPADADGRKPWRVTVADGATFPLAMHRLPPGLGLSPDDVAAAAGMLGLLRFDAGGWQVQPLAVRGGGKPPRTAWVGANAWTTLTAKPKKGEPDTLKVLKERAGRLLRQKA